jgi:hypothetical protein
MISMETARQWLPQSQLLYDWRFAAKQFILATSPLRLTTSFFFQLNTCGHSSYVTSWRKDGSVIYNCFWFSPAQSFSGPSPAGLITTFYCLRFETPPTWRARSPYLYPPTTGWPNYTPRHWVPFSSPPISRRTTAEVFEPASIRASTWALQSQSGYHVPYLGHLTQAKTPTTMT